MEAEEERRRAREGVFEQVQRAFTRAEVEEARVALEAHLAAYPDDEPWGLAHGLGVSVACLKEREEQARVLQLTEQEHRKREQMLKETQVALDPAEERDSLARIDRAQEEVRRWLERYPSDLAAASRLAGLKASKALGEAMRGVLREMDPSNK